MMLQCSQGRNAQACLVFAGIVTALEQEGKQARLCVVWGESNTKGHCLDLHTIADLPAEASSKATQ
jgi:hypothetical protein